MASIGCVEKHFFIEQQILINKKLSIENNFCVQCKICIFCCCLKVLFQGIFLAFFIAYKIQKKF